MCKRAHLNGLMEYMRLGNLVKSGLIIQLGKIRGSIVRFEITEKGQDVLSQFSDAAHKDNRGSHQYHRDDLRLLGLLMSCHIESPCQIQETARETP